jgi:hypothetical protein
MGGTCLADIVTPVIRECLFRRSVRHRFCGLSYVLGLPGCVLVAVWPVLVR